MVLESAGGALRQMHGRPAAPARKGPSFSRMLILLVMLVGTMIFMQGEFAASGNDHLPNPLFFALPFYLVIWTLLSLAKLVQKAYEMPGQPIILAGNLISHWLLVMLVILFCSTGLAIFLPKHPISTLAEHSRQFADFTTHSWTPSIPYFSVRRVDAPPPSVDQTPAPCHDFRPPNQRHQQSGANSGVNPATPPGSKWQNAPTGSGQLPEHAPKPPASGISHPPPAPNPPPSWREGGQQAGSSPDTGGTSIPPPQHAGSGTHGTSGTGTPPPDTPANGNHPGTGHGSTPRAQGDQPAPPGTPPTAAVPDAHAPTRSPVLDFGQRMKTAGLDVLISIAKAGEWHTAVPAPAAPAPATSAPAPVPDTRTAPGTPSAHHDLPAQTRAVTSASAPAPPDPVAAKSAYLHALLRENPRRWWKLALSAGLLLAVILLLFLAWRYKWLRRLCRMPQMQLPAYFRRLCLRREEDDREQIIAQLIRDYDPFADPWLAPDERTPRQQVTAVYQTFLAYLALLGLQRKTAQTEFDFATWLQKASPLDPRAVWTITHVCTTAQYAQSPPGDNEMMSLHEALQLITDDVLQRVPAEELEPLKHRYRYTYAKSQYDARKAKEQAQGKARLQTSEG